MGIPKPRHLGDIFYYSEFYKIHDKFSDEIEFIAFELGIRDKDFSLTDVINQIIENQTVK